MKKLTITLAIAAFAFALTSAPASACDAMKGAQASANGKSSCNMAKMAGSSESGDMSTMDMSMMKKDCPLANGTFTVAVYKVDGLTCGGCEINLTNAFEASEGVVMVPNVSYADGTAKVIYDPTLTNPDALTKVISDAGYKGEIIPAVAVSNSSDGATASMKKGCSMGSMAKGEGTASMKKGCSMGSMAKADGNSASMKSGCQMGHRMTNADGSMDMSHCSMGASQLTASEMKAFCQKFCMSGAKATKTSAKKSKDSKDI